jgi:co-chaperonin GroES (HSP10)
MKKALVGTLTKGLLTPLIAAIVKAPTSPIAPTDDHILIEYLPAPGLTPGGLFIPLSAHELNPERRKWDKSYQARVLAVGPGRRKLRKAYKVKGEWVMVPVGEERIPMALKAGDIVAIRQQNFPYEKRLFFPGAAVGDKIYFARESDVDGLYS